LDTTTNILTITLEDGGTKTVDLSGLDNAGTDDQQLSLDATTNILTLEDGGTVDLSPYLDNTDDQQITAFDLDTTTNILTITLEDGGTKTVDLSGLDNAGTDDQQLSLDATTNILTLEDGGTVDLSPYLDNTDDQQITAFDLDTTTNILTITLEDGGTKTVDLSNVNTDDQQLSLDATTNILTLEDGGTVDLSPYLDNTDDQQITAFDLDTTTNILTITLEDGGTKTVDLSGLDNSGTDDQQLSLDATTNILTLEDGGTVDLSPYLDNTDDQQITAFDLDTTTNILTITLEDGGTKTVDLSGLDNAGTDDQQLSLDATTNILTLEDGGTVDLSPYLDNTDDQQITAFDLDTTTNILTITLEDGGTKTVDLSGLSHSGTTGSIFFAGSDGKPTENNDNLFWDNANLRLGLGTSTPNRLMQAVSSSGNASGEFVTDASDKYASLEARTDIGTLAMLSHGSTRPGPSRWGLSTIAGYYEILGNRFNGEPVLPKGLILGTREAVPLHFGTNNTWRMTIDANGNVGVGTQNPQRPLHLSVDDSGHLTILALENRNTTNGNGSVLSFRTTTTGAGGGTFQENAAITATYVEHDHATRKTDLNLWVRDGSTWNNVVLKANGNFGIGTNSPDEKLHVAGNMRLDGTFEDKDGDAGIAGQVLVSTASGTDWQDASSVVTVVSADSGNEISTGSDGGAFFASPVRAMGKVASDGTAVKIKGATVTRLSQGNYQVTFDTPMPDADYIIQLTLPDRQGVGNDDPGITYYDQQTTGFKVNIGDNDNGKGDRNDYDSEFMFTIFDF